MRGGTLIPLFFFNDTATTEIYTLSLHDALPISTASGTSNGLPFTVNASKIYFVSTAGSGSNTERESTPLNSSHPIIMYGLFSVKKKRRKPHRHRSTLPASPPLARQPPATCGRTK